MRQPSTISHANPHNREVIRGSVGRENVFRLWEQYPTDGLDEPSEPDPLVALRRAFAWIGVGAGSLSLLALLIAAIVYGPSLVDSILPSRGAFSQIAPGG